MNHSVRRIPLGQLLSTLCLLAYGAGYAAIRVDCESVGAMKVVPSYLLSNGTPNLLCKLYRPLFTLERRSTGHAFTRTLWGDDGSICGY